MKKLVGFIFVIFFFGFWELAATQHWLDTQFIPTFSTVIEEMREMLA